MKTTSSSYYYSGIFDCGKCSVNNNRDNSDDVPTIEFKPNSGDTKNKDIIVEMKIDDEESEIVSYAYTIYEKKEDGSSVVVKQIDFREYDNKKIEIVLNKKGTFYIEVMLIILLVNGAIKRVEIISLILIWIVRRV